MYAHALRVQRMAEAVEEQLKHTRKYMLASLCNAPTTVETQLCMDINHDRLAYLEKGDKS